MNKNQKTILIVAICLALCLKVESLTCTNPQLLNERKNLCVSDCNLDAKVDTTEINKTTFCFSCPLSIKYQQFGQCSNCWDQGKIQDELSGTCILKEDCTGFLNADGSICWKDSCKGNQKLVVVDGKNTCQVCATLSNSDNTNCIEAIDCISPNVVDTYLNQCRSTCSQGFEISGKCYSKCPLQYETTYDASPFKCTKCPTEKPYVDSSTLKCVASCTSSQITNERDFICYNLHQECSIRDKVFFNYGKTKCIDSCGDKNYSPQLNADFQRECRPCIGKYHKYRLGSDGFDDYYCVDVCGGEEVPDADTNYCVKQSTCPIVYNNFCIKKCPNFTYQKDATCVSQCDTTDITDEVKKACYTDKDQCGNYLVDGKKCVSQVSECTGKYFYDSDSTKPYKRCDSLCSKEDPNANFKCIENCSDPKTYLTEEYKSFCGGCPTAHPLKFFESQTQIRCIDACKGTDVLEVAANTCLPRNQCQGYVTQDNKCIETCTKFMYANSTPKLCNEDCGAGQPFYQYVDGANTLKYCYQCPTGHDYKILIKGTTNYNCIDSCTISAIENYTCLADKNECKTFLQNENKCISFCYDQRVADETTPYKTCKTCSQPHFIHSQDNGTKYCDKCPNGLYGKLQGSDYVCMNTCPSGMVSDEDKKICLASASDCVATRYLFNFGASCADKCRDGDFIYEKTDANAATKCEDTCWHYDITDPKKCYTTCPGNVNYSSIVDNKDYCISCPKYAPIKQKKQLSDSYLCLDKCPVVGQVFDVKTTTCLDSKAQCSYFLKDETFCQEVCDVVDKLYTYISDSSTPYKLCTSKCALLQGDKPTEYKCYQSCPDSIVYTAKLSDTKIQNYCNQCPSEFPKKTKIETNKYSCSSECGLGFVLIPDTLECIPKNDCKEYLVDDVQCTSTCNPDFYLSPRITNSYQPCTSTCSIFPSGDGTSKQCLQQCNGSVFTIQVNKKDIQYCDVCPEATLPFKTKIDEKTHNCSVKCDANKIIEVKNKVCLSTKEECKTYLVDGITCEDSCMNTHYTFPLEFDKLPYKRCDLQCQEGYISDLWNKKCYPTKNDCPKFIQYDGKNCIDMCSPTEYFTVGEKQCKVCRQFIKETATKGGIIIDCLDKCEEGEMIYIFGPQKEFKKCVPSSFCENKKITATDPTKCSETCIIPDIEIMKPQCGTKCKDGETFQIDTNTCSNGCLNNQKKSSDGLLCVSYCELLFETIDPDDSSKCKKCESGYYWAKIDADSRCEKIVENDPNLQQTQKSDLTSQLESPITTPQVAEKAEEAVQDFSKTVEDNLQALLSKGDITQADLEQAKKSFEDVLEVGLMLLKSIDPTISKAPIVIGSSELKITCQRAQPGQKFKVSFDSAKIQSGTEENLLEQNTDESNTTFDPEVMQVSYVKNNHFCTGADCKTAPPLFTISIGQKTPPIGRLLASNNQEFTMVHTISADKNPKKQVCLNYDNGVATKSEGVLNGNKITCTFTTSSALMNDINCIYVDKSLCPKINNDNNNNSTTDNTTNEGESTEEDELSGGAIAGIVIGVLTFVGFISVVTFFQIRKHKLAKNKSNMYTTHNDAENHLNSNQNVHTNGEPENLKPSQPILKLE